MEIEKLKYADTSHTFLLTLENGMKFVLTEVEDGLRVFADGRMGELIVHPHAVNYVLLEDKLSVQTF